MDEICVIGPVTKDLIYKDGKLFRQGPGGAAYYAAMAAKALGVTVSVFTQLADEDRGELLKDFRDSGIAVHCGDLAATMIFENHYFDRQDAVRTQRVLSVSRPFEAEKIETIQARFIHLGPLLSGDFDLSCIAAARDAASLVALDVQGFLRERDGENIRAVPWADKNKALPEIDILKADETEALLLTGENDVRHAARVIAEFGPREVIITCGARGSLIYAAGEYFDIAAFEAGPVVDTTGCGDTYMGAYLAKRLQSDDVRAAGEYASEIAGLKATCAGAFKAFPR